MKISKSRLKEIIADVIQEESDYQAFFKKALEKAGKSIPQMSDQEKKDFFNKIEKAWKGKGEKTEGNAFGAAVAKAKKDGDDSFEVDGKEYKVEEESVNEDVFDDNGMRKAFPWANKKELETIYKTVYSGGSGGVEGIIKKYSKDRTFKPFIKKATKLFFESVNEGYSTEEKRIVMMAVRKIAKYMNRDLKTALRYVIGAAQELEKSGKVK